MLQLTRQRNLDAVERGTLELKLADAAHVPWPDDAFTVALSANTFFFIEQPDSVLAELRRVLAPGGRLIIGTVPGPLPQPSVRNWWVYVWGSRMHVYDDHDMRAMLERTGFADVTVTRSLNGSEPVQLICASCGPGGSREPSVP
jgi:SAM-dependent methyltransferase